MTKIQLPTSVRRGHGRKIAEAIQALDVLGQLPPNLRPVTRDQRIIEWLTGNGYAGDLPTRSAIARYFSDGRCNVGKSVETVAAGIG